MAAEADCPNPGVFRKPFPHFPRRTLKPQPEPEKCRRCHEEGHKGKQYETSLRNNVRDL